MGAMDPIQLQRDLRNNQEDIQSFVRDLRNWTDQMKKEDKKLSSQTQSKTDNSKGEIAHGGKDGGHSERPIAPKYPLTTESADGQRKKMAKSYEPSEEVLRLKEVGNEFLKKKEYDEAIKHYSAAMKLDPNYHILPANRGMAYLKLNSFERAEEDCGKAVALDPTYIKGYLRRGTARLELGKLQLAKEDYQKVVKLEPHNSQAKMSLERIKLEEAKQARLKAVKPESDQPTSKDGSAKTSKTATDPSEIAEKPAHLRSKKPLKKIPVMHVRNDDELESFIDRGYISLTENVPESHRNGAERLSPVKREEAHNMSGEVFKSIGEQNPSGKDRERKDATEKVSKFKETQKMTPEVEIPPHTVTRTLTLPTAPRSSYEFVRDWKLLRSHGGLRSQYLRQIPPGDYATIFKQALEESTLAEILHVAESLSAPEAASHLRGLSHVRRVDVLVMFMGADDRRLLLNLVSKCEADGQDMSDVKKRVGV